MFLSREGLKRACQRIQKVLLSHLSFMMLPAVFYQNRLIGLRLSQDETVHTAKVLALASLCIPLGACVTAAVCSATLWSMEKDAKEAQLQGTAVVMQGKVCQQWYSCNNTCPAPLAPCLRQACNCAALSQWCLVHGLRQMLTRFCMQQCAWENTCQHV